MIATDHFRRWAQVSDLGQRFHKRYLIPVFSAMLVCVVIGIRVEMLWRLHQLSVDRALDATTNAATTLADEFDDAIQEADRRLSQEEQWLRAHAILPRDRPSFPLKQAALASAAGDPLLRGVLIFDPAGSLVRGAPGVSGTMAERIGRGVREAHRPQSNTAVQVADFTEESGYKPALLLVSRRLTDRVGVLSGFIAIGVDPAAVVVRHVPPGLRQNGRVMILHEDGRILAGWPEVQSPAQEARRVAPAWLDASFHGDVGVDAALMWPKAGEHISAFRRVRGLPLIVLTGASNNDVLAAWRRDRVTFSIVMPLGALMVIWLTWFAMRQLRLRDDALAALARGERGLRAVVNGSIQGLIVHRGGKPVFANQRAAEILGYASAAELTALDSLDRTIAPDELERLHAYRQARLGGRPAPDAYEFRGIRKDGSPYWAETRVSDLEWEGQPATLATLFDVTQRRQAEENLRASERLLQTVIDAIPHSVWVKDLEHRYQIVNPAMAERWGTRPEDMIGRQTPRPEHATQPEFPRILEQERKVLLTGNTAEWVLDINLPDGTLQKFRQIRAPLRDAAGRTVGLVGVGEDVTDRYAAEGRLKAQQQLMDLMINSLPHSIWVKDLDGRFLLVNEANARVNGLTREQIIGKRVTELPLAPGWTMERLADMDRKVAETLAPVESGDVDIVLPDGTQQIRRLVKIPLLDSAGRLSAVMGISEDVTERRRAEERIAAQQRLLDLVINTLPHTIFVKDLEGRYVLVNEANARVRRLPREEVVGKRPEDLRWGNPKELARIVAMDREVIATRRPVVIHDMPITLDDGARQYRDFTKLPLLDGSGNVVGIVGITVDNTQRRVAELALRESERRFKDFTEAASDWFWEMDADLRYTSVIGPAYSDRVRNAVDVIGKTIVESPHPPEDRPAREALLRRMRQREPVRNLLMRTLRADGTVLTVRYSGVPVFDAAGQFLGYRGTGTDISEEMEARRQADLAHARLSDAIAQLPAGFLLWDAQERLVLWNARMADTLPHPDRQLRQGIAFPEYFQLGVDNIAEGFGTCREERIRLRLEAFRRADQTLEWRTREGRWFRMMDRRTSEGGTVTLRYDITDAKQRETQVLRAQKMETLGQLTGGIAHDFNNLMQVILGYAALGLKATDTDSPVREFLVNIRAAGQRAAEVTQHLLAFSRKQVLRAEPMDLNALIGAQASLLGRMLGEQIRVDACPFAGLPLVMADRGLLEQVIMNLVINARDVMPEGGAIQLSTGRAEADAEFCREHPWARPGGYALLRCADTGQGMTREVRERLFEPFFTTKEPGKGGHRAGAGHGLRNCAAARGHGRRGHRGGPRHHVHHLPAGQLAGRLAALRSPVHSLAAQGAPPSGA